MYVLVTRIFNIIYLYYSIASRIWIQLARMRHVLRNFRRVAIQ